VVDSDFWPASFALLSDTTQSNECLDGSEQHEDDEFHDSDDEIDDMRQRKKLFYKLDRGSREFEENRTKPVERTQRSARRSNLPSLFLPTPQS
jgi:large subunit ribosomal protein L18